MSDKALDAVRARRRVIADEVAKLTNEDGELAAAERALRRLLGAEAEMLDVAPPRPLSQREHILGALENGQKPWVSTQEMLAIVKHMYGVVLPVRSVRPLLSVMKSEGIIARNGRQIALTRRAREAARRPKR